MFKFFLSCHKITYFTGHFPSPLDMPSPAPGFWDSRAKQNPHLTGEERLGRGGWYTGGITCLFPCLQASLPVWLIAVILKLSKPRLGQKHHTRNLCCPQGRVGLPGKSQWAFAQSRLQSYSLSLGIYKPSIFMTQQENSRLCICACHFQLASPPSPPLSTWKI